ncbi:MAG: hypothetical protein RL030_658, partial [Pseudomonadota bacterium]
MEGGAHDRRSHRECRGPCKYLLQGDSEFHARHRGTQTGVYTPPERQVPVRFPIQHVGVR